MNLLKISAERILIDLRHVIRKDYSTYHLQILEDQLILHYAGQQLCFYSTDGNNVLLPELVEWIKLMQHGLGIPNDKICFVSVSPSLPQWQWQPYPLDAFVRTNKAIDLEQIDRNLARAKFVGVLSASRFSIARFRLIHTLAHAFPTDTFITHKSAESLNRLDYVKNYYIDEFNWVSSHEFYHDTTPMNPGQNVINYINGCKTYCDIWNKYHIEIVTETDEYQNQWFTDKIAKCLCTGKPFLLLSGQHSLKNLKQMGFETFDQCIDESYDECVLPGQRIQAMIRSLRSLYDNPNKMSIIQQMQTQAAKNIDIYQQYCNTHPTNVP
jgi:hypothetical protein